MKMYEVGGCVRDAILGTPSKDIDFTVVLEQADIDAYSAHNKFTAFEYMVFALEGLGFKLIPEATKEEYLTARGFFPKDHAVYPGKPADFVLARKDGTYSDGRRPDSVEIGTLEDDLARRDFTMNAVAKVINPNGLVSYFDPHGGVFDIHNKVIRAVGEPMDRLREDALRAVRALRFSVTKDFKIERELKFAMESAAVLDRIRDKSITADERINDELSKMFRHDTIKSMLYMNEFPQLTAAIFSGNVSLDSTLKTKGRGKPKVESPAEQRFSCTGF